MTSTATEYPDDGLPMPHVRADVAQYMAATQRQYRFATEFSWACTWDAKARLITAARLIGRGGASEALVIRRDLKEGDVVLHSHPTGILTASSTDLVAAHDLDHIGIGFGIVDQDVTALYMVREPRPIPPIGKRSPYLQIGRLLVMWSKP